SREGQALGPLRDAGQDGRFAGRFRPLDRRDVAGGTPRPPAGVAAARRFRNEIGWSGLIVLCANGPTKLVACRGGTAHRWMLPWALPTLLSDRFRGFVRLGFGTQ